MRALSLFALLGMAACTGGFGPGEQAREARPFEAADIDPDALRFVAWNINTVGIPGDAEYIAMLDVVNRLQPDVLAISEVEDDSDSHDMETFAEDAGYAYVVQGDASGFGGDRNAILSRYPLTGYGVQLDFEEAEAHHLGWTSPELSGDEDALDLSRVVVAAAVHTPLLDIGVIPVHWKSGGTTNKVEFRRAVDTYRHLQGFGMFGDDVDHFVLAGDYNVDIFDNAPTPDRFYEVPTGNPARYSLGSDVADFLPTDGLKNHPHEMVADFGMVWREATQVTGSYATRPSSGRVLDYVYDDGGMTVVGTEVYNSANDTLNDGVPKLGESLDVFATAAASDHLPIVVDYDLSGGAPDPGQLTIDDLIYGDLVITEVMANPDNCTDNAGEWIEIHNVSGFDIDLTGLALTDAAGNYGSIGNLFIAPEGRMILSRSADVCDVTPNAVYGSDVSLNNSGDTLNLLGGNGSVFTLEYGSAAGAAGLSYQVDGDTWCAGPATPGEENISCD